MMNMESIPAGGQVARKYFFFYLIWLELGFSDLIGFKCANTNKKTLPTSKWEGRWLFPWWSGLSSWRSAEVCVKNAKQSWQNLCWILKVSWGENIATPPISDVFAFLTKCICNLILCPFFANNPREKILSQVFEIYLLSRNTCNIIFHILFAYVQSMNFSPENSSLKGIIL